MIETNTKKKIMVLFANDWGLDQYRQKKYKDQYDFIIYNRDLFHFPTYLQLTYFNVSFFLRRLIKRLEQEKISAVLSSDEYIAAILAAMAAKSLGLPGANPEKVILSQHKYFSRLEQKKGEWE